MSNEPELHLARAALKAAKGCLTFERVKAEQARVREWSHTGSKHARQVHRNMAEQYEAQAEEHLELVERFRDFIRSMEESGGQDE